MLLIYVDLRWFYTWFKNSKNNNETKKLSALFYVAALFCCRLYGVFVVVIDVDDDDDHDFNVILVAVIFRFMVKCL